MHFVLPIFLLFFSFFNPSQACLKVESSATTTTTVTTTTVKPSCNNCLFVPLDADNIETYIGDHPSYPNIRKHGVIPPKVQRVECSLSISCPSTYTLVALSDTNYQEFNQLSLEAVCNKYSGQWTTGGTEDYAEIFAQLYGVCVKFNSPCPCSWEVLSLDNVKTLIDGSWFYQLLIWGPTRYEPTITYDANGCPIDFDCNATYVSWYYDVTDYQVNGIQKNVSCNTETLMWDTYRTVSLPTKKFYPVCWWHDEWSHCRCRVNSINDLYGYTFYRYYSFLQTNASYYRYYTADLHIPETGCVSHVTCEAGLTMVILGEQVAVVQSGEAFIECSNNEWSITYDNKNYKEVPNIQFICVDYSKPIRCLCSFGTFDNSLGSEYYEQYPFLETNASQYKYFPAQLEVSEDKCVSRAACPRHLTIVLLGKYTMSLKQPQVYLDCEKKSWTAGFDDCCIYDMSPNLNVICVDFAKKLDCPCLIDTLDYYTLSWYYEDYPFLQSNATSRFWYPAEFQYGSSGCAEKASCPSGRTLVILGKVNAIVKSKEASLTCSASDGVSLSYDGITRQERSNILVVCVVST